MFEGNELYDYKNINETHEVVLGDRIRLADFISVAMYGAKVKFSDEYCRRVENSRKLVERFLKEKRVIYGLTTGFGDNYSKIISPEDTIMLQKNIIRSHACSVGDPLEKEVVRGILFMMLLNLGQGYSGVRLETLECIRDVLNAGIIPFTPSHGSVGYLAPEAHISLALIGEGQAWFNGELLSGREAFNRAGIKPVELGSKEGLALVSGTTSVTAMAALALHNAIVGVKTADISGALSLEALKGSIKAYDPRLQSVRPHEEQKNTAENILSILKDSQIAEKYRDYRLQDALSLRCIPQLHGAAKKTIKDALTTIETELNSCCDNPIIYPQDDSGVALMGGNADGAYVGIEADSICIAMANIVKMAERRIDRMVNHHVSELPAFLIEKPGINNGFMIPQYTAAGILGEIRILCHPSTIDNIPTCADQEDYVSMGYNAARKAYHVSKLFQYILAIEILTAVQAIEYLKPLQPSSATRAVYNLVRGSVAHLSDDRFMYPDIMKIYQMIHDGQIVKIVENITGELKL